jgi:PTH1 family peptidyl-tRNA hydrolase
MLPQTFMNLSGQAVQPFMSFYKLEPQDLMVVFDELDIPFTSLRMKAKGSGGTHNGTKHIVQSLGTQDFPRLRFGIGPKPINYATNAFVLGKFNAEENTQLPTLIETALTHIETWVKEGINTAMKHCNSTKTKTETSETLS